MSPDDSWVSWLFNPGWIKDRGRLLMTLPMTPTAAMLGLSVTGVDLAALDDAVWADIERAFLAQRVVCAG